MLSKDLQSIVLGVIKSKPILQNLLGDQDFFDAGTSSLTLIDMQIQIEEQLKVNVPTARLIANPTTNGWISAYSEAKASVNTAEKVAV